MVFIARSVSRLARPASSLLRPSIAPPRVASKLPFGARTLTATANRQGKVLLVLYDVSHEYSYPIDPILIYSRVVSTPSKNQSF